VRNCICGQIYDSSPVDFVSDVGTQFLPKPVIGNSSQPLILRSWMAKALASGMDTLFPSRIEAQRAEYWHTLYSSAVSQTCLCLLHTILCIHPFYSLFMQGLGPVLIVCSEDDVLAPIHVICGFARRLIELGTDVKVIKWSNSPHVGASLSSSCN
jgi:acetyl esterase/lipase